MSQQNKFIDLKPYSMYKRGNNFFIKEITKNAYDFNLKHIKELQKLKDIFKKLAETKKSDTSKKIAIDKEIMTILQYYKLVHQISDSLVKQLSKIGLGHSFYDVKTIEKYQEEIISHIPKFFEEYSDVTEFTKSNWSSWKLKLIDKYLKANGFKNILQNEKDLQEKHDELKQIQIDNFVEVFNKVAEQNYKIPEDIKDEIKKLKVTNSGRATTILENIFNEFYTIIALSKSKSGKPENVEIPVPPDIWSEFYDIITRSRSTKGAFYDEPNIFFKIPISPVIDIVYDNEKVKLEFNESYTDLINFIDETLDIEIQDYKEENNIEFDSFTPFNDGKKRKIKKH